MPLGTLSGSSNGTREVDSASPNLFQEGSLKRQVSPSAVTAMASYQSAQLSSASAVADKKIGKQGSPPAVSSMASYQSAQLSSASAAQIELSAPGTPAGTACGSAPLEPSPAPG